MEAVDVVLSDHGIPEVRSVVGLALQQPLRVPIWIWVRPWIRGELAYSVLAPDRKSLGRFGRVNHPGTVSRECVYAGLEVR